MRNRISCTARTLGQLEPDMVHSVVGEQVYEIGNEYFSDNRVTILEADSMQIVSEVSGTSGVYSQTIKLQSGTLQTKCSCPSKEQPFCRHCVAVLIHNHYDHRAKRMADSYTSESENTNGRGNGDGSSPSVDFNFRDVTIFIDWIQEAIPALSNGGELPNVPPVAPDGVGQWVESIEALHQRVLKTEEERHGALKDLATNQKRMAKLTRDLEQSKRESTEAQGALEDLQKENERYLALFAGLAGVCQAQDQVIEQVHTMKVDLQKKDRELEALSVALQTLFKSIRGVLPPHLTSQDSENQ